MKTKTYCICILFFLMGAWLFFSPSSVFAMRSATHGLHVAGNHFVDGGGNTIILRGASRWSLEFSCGDGHFNPSDFQAMKSWGMDIVRVPLNENYFLHPELCNGQYQNTVFNAVSTIEAAGMYALLDLHWTFPPVNNVDNRGGQFPLPNANSRLFWQQLAQKYANDDLVIFEPMNEPHDISCTTWLNGGTVNSAGGTGWINQVAGTYQGIGFQELVNLIHGISPNKLIIQGASGEADASCAVSNPLRGTNIAYQSHFYHTDPNTWKSQFTNLTSNIPVIAGEFDSTQGNKAIQVFEGLKTGYLGWAWHGSCGMTTDFNGTPCTAWQPIHDFMLAAANADPPITVSSPTATPTPTPTSIQITPSATPAPGDTFLTISVCPHGIGNCGDNVSPTGGNPHPLNISKPVTLSVYDITNTLVANVTGNVTYTSAGMFTGTIDMQQLPSGSYLMFAKMPQYLRKRLPGIQAVIKGQTTVLPSITLTTGDLKDDNVLDAQDYSILISCYGNKFNTSSCLSAGADLNDDGAVDGIDYNLFVREISVLFGE